MEIGSGGMAYCFGALEMDAKARRPLRDGRKRDGLIGLLLPHVEIEHRAGMTAQTVPPSLRPFGETRNEHELGRDLVIGELAGQSANRFA